MKSTVCFLVLAFTLALSQNDVHAQKRGKVQSKLKPRHTPGEVTVLSTEDALRDLIQAGQPIRESMDYFFLSPFCRTLDMVSKFQITDYGRRCDFNQTCYVVGFPSDNANVSLHVITKDTGNEETPGSEQCANMPEFQAVILPFRDNENTYMILDPERAPWFFTDMLGGCDIFVATAQNQGNKPLVIHANRNLCDDQEKNLKSKGDSVNNMLANINGNYRVIARAYYKSRNPQELVTRINTYINQYEQNIPGIKLLPYNNCERTPQEQGFYFFGQYLSTQQPAHWRFYLKGMKDGSLSHFDVSQQGSLTN